MGEVRLELPGAVQVGGARPLDHELPRGPGVLARGGQRQALALPAGTQQGSTWQSVQAGRIGIFVWEPDPSSHVDRGTPTPPPTPTPHPAPHPAPTHLCVTTRSTSSPSAARSSSASSTAGTLRARLARLSCSSSSSLSARRGVGGRRVQGQGQQGGQGGHRAGQHGGGSPTGALLHAGGGPNRETTCRQAQQPQQPAPA